MALQPRHTLERTRVDPLTQMPLQQQTTKALVLQSKCRAEKQSQAQGAKEGDAITATAMATARPLDWLVAEAATEWPVNCEVRL